jgi:hypothetical protein
VSWRPKRKKFLNAKMLKEEGHGALNEGLAPEVMRGDVWKNNHWVLWRPLKTGSFEAVAELSKYERDP